MGYILCLQYDMIVGVHVRSVAQSCLTLCDPVDWRLSGSSVHGIFQARILEWVDSSSSWNLHDPGIEPASPALQVDYFFTTEPPGIQKLNIYYSLD